MSVENGERIPTKLSEKLNRNEDKLKESVEAHTEKVSTLCNLLDEITTGGWKDLKLPSQVSVLQWEVTYHRRILKRRTKNAQKTPTTFLSR
jgi:hypothetical protein